MEIYILLIIGLIVVYLRVPNLIYQFEKRRYLNMNIENFEIDDCFIVGKQVLFIDNTVKKWFIHPRGLNNQINPERIYKFSDIFDYEKQELKKKQIAGKMGQTLLGSFLWGIEGAVIASSGKKNLDEVINYLQIRMRINDFNNPEVVLKFNNKKLKIDSKKYRKVNEEAEKLYAIITYMANQKHEQEIYIDKREN